MEFYDRENELETLAAKTIAIQKHLAKYEVSLKALSLNDM